MQRRTMTPPSLQVDGIPDAYFQPGSATTSCASETPNCSPQSYLTADTTPPTASPTQFREYGQLLLPKVRSQDHIVDHLSDIRTAGHTRAHSVPSTGGYMQFGAQLEIPHKFHTHNLTGPYFDNTSPVAGPSMHAMQYADPYAQSMQYHYQANQANASPVQQPHLSRAHGRNLSTSSVDFNSVPSHCRFTYRLPGPQPNNMISASNALNHLMPMVGMSHGPSQNHPIRRRNPSPQARPSLLSSHVEVATGAEQDTCLAEYLSKPNPKLSIVPKVEQSLSARNDDVFWFDVRNVRPWADFNIDTINNFKDFPKLLHIQATLNEPLRIEPYPQTREQLVEITSKHHLQKLNTALAFTLGADHHLSARRMERVSPSRQHKHPDFLSNYSSDATTIEDGSRRSRVVGITRCFNEWHSDMQTQEAKRVEYLAGLAALQMHMRNHRCRYGFIMTEIELLCVRAGGECNADGIPYFGFLEVAKVETRVQGRDSHGQMQMTTGLALWYLHMLARDQTLPGQMGWQLPIGGKAVCSRQSYLPTDSWITNKPLTREKRTAKQKRKWVDPGDPATAAELGRTRRRVG